MSAIPITVMTTTAVLNEAKQIKRSKADNKDDWIGNYGFCYYVYIIGNPNFSTIKSEKLSDVALPHIFM